MIDLNECIRDVPDFPKPGILFKDITPLLANPPAMRETADRMAEPFRGEGVDYVAGIESRGFIFGSLIAERLEAGFVPIRKPGKLPWQTIQRTYDLEYGRATIEVHRDAVEPGSKVLMVDDLLATGGTISAACELVGELGAKIVGLTFVIELAFLNPRQRLPGHRIHSLIRVDGE